MGQQTLRSCITTSVQRSGSHLSGVHADGHLTVQVALGDHVRAAGVHHLGRLQGLHKVPVDGLVAVPSGHLLETQRDTRGPGSPN